MIRLGGPLFPQRKIECPDDWVREMKAAGYRAGPCPATAQASDAELRLLRETAAKHDLLIAEVGAWSNPISPDNEQREAALEKCRVQLDLADKVGACCCVNITGSRDADKWDGPHPDNLSQDTFDLIVESIRKIVDAVKPTRTYYALETMPWVFPDSPESYRRLLDAIDRERVAVHLDPVNLVNCPSRAYDTTGLLKRCFELLGDQIVSCHAKDIGFTQHLTIHLDEMAPGQGVMDYHTFLKLLDELGRDVPLLTEHLSGEEAYTAAANHIRSVADEIGVSV